MYYNKILGGIVGDIIGSTREWLNIKTEDFELLPQRSRFTDDTVMTLAVAEWLMTDPMHSKSALIECMQRLGRKYPKAGYGRMFGRWLVTDNPEPYNSFGNGSAMRVSPVGLYANSMEEALELARITASVSHNHPEGIKGAQAIAAAIYIKRTEMFDVEGKIKHFIEKHFGYNLDIDLRKIRKGYAFDVTCQGSVPIAIMAFLQEPYSAEKAIRLAVSMGGDSDTIGCMTASIATAERPHTIRGGSLSHEIVDKCRELLPPDLLDINDRFLAFINRPLNQSYEVSVADGVVYAGEYPGDKDEQVARRKIARMYHFGIRHFIDLTEDGELRPYNHLLPSDTTYTRFPIVDCGVPKSVESVQRLLLRIEELTKMEGYVYLHCWGGVGRTGTIVACYLTQNWEEPNLKHTLEVLRRNFSEMPKSANRETPETKEQMDFIEQFINAGKSYKKEKDKRVHDCIRGCLMAGAAGDALGYEVEFMSRRSILSHFGENGITKFTLGDNGKALISDDTQMTLFTANGLLMGLTRGYMRGIGGSPEKYVDGAYLDWYYTQTGKKRELLIDDWHPTWLRGLPEMAQLRAPGNTCLSACESLFRGENVQNNSKGCGGIMRVAPMALLDAGYASRNKNGYPIEELAEAGGEIAEVTHKHPLGFLPASLLTVLLYKVVPMSSSQVYEEIDSIIADTMNILDRIYKGKYESNKQYLKDLTNKAVCLAHSDISDADAIRELGEGWVAEETWAIALYCAIRHIDSVEDAIIASVNHDGDSDSTGSVCGNIMGAIYGYEHIKERNIFCPDGKNFEDTLELSEIILALADDISTGCIISEYDPIDTPEKRQWHERYCEMRPVGLNKRLMYSREYTPKRISELKENEIFVFGSNLAGEHGGGAARLAYKRFGAIWGEGVGLHGQTYAIPTMQKGVETIKPYVDAFIRFAKEHNRLTFLVTRIGCGIAGFRDEEIAPLFTDAIDVNNIILPKEFVENISPEGKRNYCLERFLTAHKFNYENALREITDGRKRTHWIWFIFPQLAVLGHSANAKYYGISGYDEAKAYYEHPILGARLREITMALLQHRGESAVDILGDIDAVKVRSCMTLFDAVSPDDIFQEVLNAFYGGAYDKKTLDYM